MVAQKLRSGYELTWLLECGSPVRSGGGAVEVADNIALMKETATTEWMEYSGTERKGEEAYLDSSTFAAHFFAWWRVEERVWILNSGGDVIEWRISCSKETLFI